MTTSRTVVTSDPVAGQAPVYNADTGQYEPKSIGGGVSLNAYNSSAQTLADGAIVTYPTVPVGPADPVGTRTP